MADVLMVLLMLAFFAVCVAYVTWCGRIIGPDPDETETTDGEIRRDDVVGAR